MDDQLKSEYLISYAIIIKNEKRIREYIQNQLQEDKLYDQMSLKEFIDPFTGEPVERGKKKKPFKG